MMRVVGWIAGMVLLLVAGVFGMQMIASESGEVVVLHSVDAAGEEQETRLWVVDLEGSAYLRVGADGSGWYSRLQANPKARVQRGPAIENYLIVPRPEFSAQINDLMHDKYGWADGYISLMFDRVGAIPLQLQPINQSRPGA